MDSSFSSKPFTPKCSTGALSTAGCFFSSLLPKRGLFFHPPTPRPFELRRSIAILQNGACHSSNHKEEGEGRGKTPANLRRYSNPRERRSRRHPKTSGPNPTKQYSSKQHESSNIGRHVVKGLRGTRKPSEKHCQIC